MARYRKVYVRIWVDEKFKLLSTPPPCGQFLFLYLLTNPDTVNVPGLYRAGELAMAEALGWPLEGFREAFLEVLSQGMVEADWKNRVVWVPKAIHYNKPDNPNVVKSWSVAWDEIPECDLKAQAHQTLKAFLKGLGEPFVKAFEDGCRKPLAKGMANQEQEQEQEQEKEQEEERGGTPPSPPTPPGVESVQKPQADFGPDELATLWNATCDGLPKATELSAPRRKKLIVRLREHPQQEWWEALFEKIQNTPFACGDNDRGWRVDLGWLTENGDNALNVLGGRYDGRKSHDRRRVNAGWAGQVEGEVEK